MNKDEIKLSKLAKCAGCGAKVGAGTLAQLLDGLRIREDERLLVGFDKSDDACVYKLDDGLALVQTLDFFPPIVDDPYTFGQIAAANALSDIYAMGGEPKLALNMLCVPSDMPKEAVHDILRGGYDKAYEAGAIIAGGHSILDDEPKYGLSVTGFVHPERVLKNSGAHAGDMLLFTKRLGTGILTTAAKVGMCSEESMKNAVSQMTELNKYARDIMIKYRIHACTDVTGFGFLGHLYEMAKGSELRAAVYTDRISIFPEALTLAGMGVLPEGMYRNREFAAEHVDAGTVPLSVQDALYDPQTSGGLLISVHPDDAEKLLKELDGAAPCAQLVGAFGKRRGDEAYIALE